LCPFQLRKIDYVPLLQRFTVHDNVGRQNARRLSVIFSIGCAGQAAAYDAIVEGDLTLLSVSFSDANTGTVVGDGGVILRTTDGGATWRLQPSGTSNSLLGVYFTDATTGTVVGETGTILRTRTGGQPPASATPAASNRRF
jgi:photosystem II stability/assembly factor-like uncharacterized protein